VICEFCYTENDVPNRMMYGQYGGCFSWVEILCVVLFVH